MSHPPNPAWPRPGDLPAQNMLSVMRIRVEALHTGRSTRGRLTTCRTLGCTSVTLVVHVSLRLPQPVTRPLNPAWSSLWGREKDPMRTDRPRSLPAPAQHHPLRDPSLRPPGGRPEARKREGDSARRQDVRVGPRAQPRPHEPPPPPPPAALLAAPLGCCLLVGQAHGVDVVGEFDGPLELQQGDVPV